MKTIKRFWFELARKGIHISIALVPFLAARDFSNTALLLLTGVLVYSCAEFFRFLGFTLPLVSSVTAALCRKNPQDYFELSPVTLGLGAYFSLLIFPPQVAAAAIFALAFGDSASLLIGKFLGRIRPAFLSGKSVEGLLSCFAAAALGAYFVFRDWKPALAAGFASLIIDMLPIGDFDNIAMPLAAGFAALFFVL
jgi:dolichol kinase